MDKRTVLALLLIAVIFIMLPYYWELVGFTPDSAKQDRKTASPAPAPTDTATGGQSASALSEPWREAAPAAPDRPAPPVAALDTLAEEFFVVETPLYTARLSSRGGALAAFNLKKYSYFRGDPIDLIPARDAYPLLAHFPEAAGLSSDQLRFTADRDRLDLVSPAAGDSAELRLTARTSGGAPVQLTYTFRRRSYAIGLRIAASRQAELARATRLELTWQGGLDPSEGNLQEDYGYFSGYVRQGRQVAKFEDFDSGRLREGSSGEIDWVATKSKYFLVALLSVDAPAEDFEISASERKTVEKGQEAAKRVFNMTLGHRLTGSLEHRFNLFLGPLDYGLLSELGYDLERTVEMGFWLFKPFAVAILWFLTAVHHLVPNYGWVIVLFTVTMKLLMFPFARKNYVQMAKMKVLQPKLKALQEKYKNDPQRLNQQMLKFYKEEKFNPLGGCLWMLPQLPIFWALFTVFKSAIQLRGAGYLWLEDLSQPSVALAVVMSAAMLVQQMLTNKDPKQRFIVYGFPVIMFFLFKGFPAGLVLYWTVFNLLSIVEQKSVERTLPRGDQPAAVQ